MLIDNGQFNLDEFKQRYKTFLWRRVPRQLGINHSDYFYVGSFEDDDWKLHVQIRPSMRMKVSESYKHCDKSGNKVDKEYNKEKYEFGTTVEVLINNEFLDRIKEISVEKKEDGIQKVSW